MQTALGGHMLPRPLLSRSPFNFYLDALFWGADARANIEAHLPLYMAKLKEACAEPFSIGGESVKILIISTTDGGLAYALRSGSPNNSLFPYQTFHINKHDSKNLIKVAGWTTDRTYREGVATLQNLSGASHEQLKKHVFPHSYGITGFSLSCTSDELNCLCASHLHWRLVICHVESIATSLRLQKKLTPWETCINKHLGVKCVLTSKEHA
jgi:hypothetical protein